MSNYEIVIMPQNCYLKLTPHPHTHTRFVLLNFLFLSETSRHSWVPNAKEGAQEGSDKSLSHRTLIAN